MTKNVPAEVKTIIDLWTKDDATKKGERITLSFQRLQSRADGYIVDAKTALLDAQAKLDKVISDAEKSPDFGVIVEAKLAVKRAQLTLTEAQTTYTEFFGAK